MRPWNTLLLTTIGLTIAGASTTGCGEAAGPPETEAASHAIENLGQATAIAFDDVSSGCTANRITFNAYMGRSHFPTKYDLWRYHASTGWVLVATRDLTTEPGAVPSNEGLIVDGSFRPFPTEAYYYAIQTYYGSTYVAPFAYAGWYVPRGCQLPSQLTHIVFPLYPNDFPPAYGPDFVNSILFNNAAGAQSMSNWMREQTMGTSGAGRRVELWGGSTLWNPLGQPLSAFPKGLGDMGDYVFAQGIAASLMSQYPSDYQTFLFNTGAYGGYTVGAHTNEVGADSLPRFSFSQVAHELGHNFGLRHSNGIYCPGALVPSDITQCEYASCGPECYFSTYGNWTDPMSAPGAVGHYNGHDKWLLQMLAGYVSTVTLGPDLPSVTTYLDDTTANNANVQQLLIVKLDNLENAYVLEYRRPLGFNGLPPVGLSHGAPLRGVYIYFRSGNATYHPFKGLDYAQHLMLDPAPGGDKVFVDPYRGLTFELLGDYNESVQVRVTKQ